MISVAASNIAWSDKQDKQAQEILRKAGINAIEVAPTRLFPEVAKATRADIESLRQSWVEEQLPVVSMQALLFGRPELKLFGNTADTKALVDYMTPVINLGGALGARPLVFGSPKNRLKGNLTFAQAKARAKPVFRQLGDLCAAADTVLCLEANAVQYGCDFMTTLEEAADIVATVDHPNVALVADTGNMLLSGDTCDDLNLVMDHVAHVHVSAPKLAPVLSEAQFIQSVVDCIKQHGYHGVVTLEMLAVDDNLETLSNCATFLSQLFVADTHDG